MRQSKEETAHQVRNGGHDEGSGYKTAKGGACEADGAFGCFAGVVRVGIS